MNIAQSRIINLIKANPKSLLSKDEIISIVASAFTLDEQEEEIVSSNGIVVDINKYEVTFNGEKVSLAKREFDLLHFFISHKGKNLSRDAILNNVWGNSDFTDKTIDVHVLRLRQKFGVDVIKTIRNFGYKWNEIL